MNISRIFIERPVFTTLFMAALVIFGVFGYSRLPVSDLPNVDFPTIQVSAGLPGADPDTMASGVAAPLENQFSTIAGIDSMTSSSRQGFTNITIQFTLEVKNRMHLAQVMRQLRRLPEVVRITRVKSAASRESRPKPE